MMETYTHTCLLYTRNYVGKCVTIFHVCVFVCDEDDDSDSLINTHPQ